MKIFRYLTLSCMIILFSCKKDHAQTAYTGTRTLKIISYNVFEGFRNDDAVKASFKNWIDSIKPDVVAFQELNHFTYEGFKKFAADMGMPYAELLKESGFPVGLASRFPLNDVKKVTTGMQHGYLYAKIQDYHFLVTHLEPNDFNKRKKEVVIIRDFIKTIPQTEKILLMGDFNNMSPEDSLSYDNEEKMRLVRASEANHPGTFILNNGKIDYSTIQTVLDMGFHDSWKMLHIKYEKSAPTKMKTHHNYTRIDYIWVNGTLKNSCSYSQLIKDPFTDYLSDHYPMELILKR